ncbi:MAG TPA: hypothetical protein VG734_14520 [Lacunisphaera sp.]|nr:hypothetical protein [Lacunisphaera sp.]
MLARFSALILLAGFCCAGAAEPKARPRLTPPVVSEVKGEVTQPALDAGSAPAFRSFDDFLQTEARRSRGLEAVRVSSAVRAEASGAEKTGQASKDANPASPQTDPDVLVLPKIEITAEKLTKLGEKLAALEAQQSWEERSAETWDHPTVVDAILNPPLFGLGSYSAGGRAGTARHRVEVARWVRILEISLEEAKTSADKARIQAEIDSIKEIARYWELPVGERSAAQAKLP